MRRTISKAWRRAKAAGGWLARVMMPSQPAWVAASNAVLILWAVVFLSFVVLEIAPGFTFERLAGFAVLFAACALIGLGTLLVLRLIGLLAPRYRLALFVTAPIVMLFGMVTWEPKGMALGAALLLAGISLAAGSVAAVIKRGATPAQRRAATVWLVVGAGLLVILVVGMAAPLKEPNPALAHYRLAGQTLALADPGKPGPYKVRYLTYGGGADRYRPEYGAKATFRSHPVDGSKLDEDWKGLGGMVRTLYWGFDPKHFPVQGRVWAPQGQGPFPLVLIVHGNHDMETFSDPGYAYLGELLASQGFILVSVDENFLNSSLADFVNPFARRSGSENDARGWLLLEHLAQWRVWAADPANPLYGKVDMDRIGLIGHSRGGEAVAVAAAFNSLGSYPDDANLAFNYHFKLGAIAAIAPSDGQYTPRDRPTPLSDINYFVIHGSLDGDVSSFVGSAQYTRDVLTGRVPAFKANLYVKDADHNQFNSTWGRNDLGLPWEFLLDERSLLKPDAQRQVAKVYLSAFLQDALLGRASYRPMLQDPRRGAGWLPPGYLAANYADSDTAWIATFDEDSDPTTAASPGAAVVGRNLSVWREEYVKLKANPLDTQVALIAWDERVHKQTASYSLDLGAAAAKAGLGTDLVFSAAASGIDSLPKGFKPSKEPKAKPGANDKEKPLDWSVVLVDAKGAQARLPLSHDQVLYPQIVSHTRRFSAIDGATPSEIVMRRYRFALADFAAQNPALDLKQLKAVRFDFDRSKRGAIALDDVGIAPVR